MSIFKKKAKKTTIPEENIIKPEYFDTFCTLVRDQFEYGGKKYALSDTRESTDELFDTFGKNWLFGTMAKYCFRYKNLKRERDLLKIACYSYLLWLKRGYFLQSAGLKYDTIDTNVKMKSENFNTFNGKIKKYFQSPKISSYTKNVENGRAALLHEIRSDSTYLGSHIMHGGNMNSIYNLLKEWARLYWADILESALFLIFVLCFEQWVEDKYYQTTTHDTDTYNA